MFSHLILLKKKFYKFCTFSVNFKDAAATVQNKKRFIPVNFDVSDYTSSKVISKCVKVSCWITSMLIVIK
jgi:hypothetical protein